MCLDIDDRDSKGGCENECLDEDPAIRLAAEIYKSLAVDVISKDINTGGEALLPKLHRLAKFSISSVVIFSEALESYYGFAEAKSCDCGSDSCNRCYDHKSRSN